MTTKGTKRYIDQEKEERVKCVGFQLVMNSGTSNMSLATCP